MSKIKGYQARKQYCKECGRLENVSMIGRFFSRSTGKKIYLLQYSCPKYSESLFALFYNFHSCHIDETVEFTKGIDGYFHIEKEV